MQGLWNCLGKQYKQGGRDSRIKAKGYVLAFKDIKGIREARKEIWRHKLHGCRARWLQLWE